MNPSIRKKIGALIPWKRQIREFIFFIKGKPRNANGTFAKAITKRHKVFWYTPEAEDIRQVFLNAQMPLEEWTNVSNWQRRLSNKYNSREFAVLHKCRVPQLYWKGNDPENIDFDSLPAHYVIRPVTGHSCNLVFLMNDNVNLMDGKVYQKEEIVSILKREIKANPHRMFLVEEFLKTELSVHKIPDDYKLYMFNGEIACIQLINRFSAHTGKTSWYDENWKRLRNINSIYPVGSTQNAPACFEEIKAHARALSKSYQTFVRIDFYATDRGAVFGEFTPTPGMGFHFTRYGNRLFGKYWNLYCKGLI